MRARGNEQRLPNLHRYGQCIMGVGGEDDIDALHPAGQLAIDIEAVVRQQHHHLGPQAARGGNRPAQLLLADAEGPSGIIQRGLAIGV